MKKCVFNIVLIFCIGLIFSCSSTKSAGNDFSKALDYCVEQATKTATTLTDTSTIPRYADYYYIEALLRAKKLKEGKSINDEL